MALVNTCVVSSLSNQTLMNWTILLVEDEAFSISSFFEHSVKPQISFDVSLPIAAYIGPDKLSLDSVDCSLSLVLVIKSFGRFLKFLVRSDGDNFCGLRVPLANGSTSSEIPSCEIQPTFSLQPVHQRNNKDKLFNDIVCFLKTQNIDILDSEVSSAHKLVSLLRDVFWYLDGHHHVFKDRATDLPLVFKQFSSYNMPQLSKHRKRLTSNISANTLNEFVLNLTLTLQYRFFERPQWFQLKTEILNLCESLSSYVNYLNQKNKRMKEYHRSPTPVRQLSSNLSLKLLLPMCGTVPPLLAAIDSLLLEKSDFEYESLMSILPPEPLKKHRFMDTLFANGVSVSAYVLMYSAGGNIGNLVFMWRVPDEIEEHILFEQSQSVIETIKSVLPRYHTRAMRAATIQKFGRISTAVKPAILRYFYKDLTGTCMYEFSVIIKWDRKSCFTITA